MFSRQTLNGQKNLLPWELGLILPQSAVPGGANDGLDGFLAA